MLKDTKANKIFLIVLVVLLALSFSLAKGWEGRSRATRSDRDFEFKANDTLKVRTIANDVVIEVDDSLKRATVSIGGNERDVLSVLKTTSNLSVEVKPKTNWFFRFFSYAPSTLVIELPSSSLDSLDVSTISGDIRIMHPMKARTVELRSTSGEIDFLTLEAEESLKVLSTSSSLSGSGATSNKELEIATVSGDIEIQKVRAKDVQLKSISSDVEAEVEIISGGSLTASSTSGELELDLRANANLNVQASTTSGTITFNERDQEGKSVELETGSAQETVTLFTVSGSIELTY
nr:DUF4097 family beta strand repeat-containing protein [uncultured Sphaerochaeta sp.]